ncbi:hypothetical protein L1049_013330 [Liquidambar formosana]|uniref:MULE transposase domain-containing protein n=1 Tax=Liquidambar formosana TaxID=63359 RepID=A0AAP0RP31_LIQFO
MPIFQRFYVCLDAYKRGFLAGYRPFIRVDSCFLKGPTGGQLLSAIGRDSNNQMFSVAFAVIERETKESWDWFFRLPLQDIRERHSITFMSNQQKHYQPCINFVTHFYFVQGLVPALHELVPNVEHRFCWRHLYDNIAKKYRGKQLRDAMWVAAKATIVYEWKKQMKRISTISLDIHKVIDKMEPAIWARGRGRRRGNNAVGRGNAMGKGSKAIGREQNAMGRGNTIRRGSEVVGRRSDAVGRGISLQVVILGVLALTVFRFRDPDIKLDFVTARNISGFSSGKPPTSINMTLKAEMVIKNHNWGEFEYDESNMVLLYTGIAVGRGDIPMGRIKMRSTVRVVVVVEANFDGKLSSDINSTVLSVNGYAKLSGKVHMMTMIKNGRTGEMNCTMTVSLTRQAILHYSCQ